MKKILKVLLNILIGIWIVIAIVTTISLLSMNDYRITELGDYSFIAVDSDDLGSDFKKGSLMIVKKSLNDNINVKDDIFYYEANNKKAIVNYGTVFSKTKVNQEETTFTLQGQQSISSEYVIGKSNETKVIDDLGYIITVLQSQWGFMFIVIFPSIFLVIYEIYNIVVEVKRKNENEE